MATKLRKFKYDGSSKSRPGTSTEKSASGEPDQATPSTGQQHNVTETETLKSDILSSILADIGSIIREEIKKRYSLKTSNI